jgi:hypothetical protein
MENLGVRDDSEQEGWGNIGPLAEPTPENTMNIGAAEKKKRRGEENITGEEEGNATNATEAKRAEERRGGPETEEHSEMEEIREAVAEAIREMETEIAQHENGLKGGDRQRVTATKRELEGIGDQRRHTWQQQQQQHEHHQQQIPSTPEATTSRPTVVTVNIAASQTDQLTPMQLMH